jgi:hypothetical protein
MTSRPMTSRPLRVGDADRLAAADRLATHTAAGRLTLAEHDHRVAAVWAARTADDLDALFADLPGVGGHRASSRSPAAMTTVLAALLVVAVLVAWLASVVNPAWAASMMAACM